MVSHLMWVRWSLNLLCPEVFRDVRAFLGLAGYYRSFIPNFAVLSKPSTLLTRKNEKFCWSEPQQTSFVALKEALTSYSVLAYSEFDTPFILSCDTSNYSISAILSQEHGGKERPLSFSSRILNKHEFNYSVTEKELLTVLFDVQTYQCFLYGRKFKVITDHAALKWLITVENHQCAGLTRWILKLSEYEFEVIHWPGRKHVNADVLSRHVAAVVRDNDTTTDVKPQQEVVLSKEFIKEAQSNDDVCQQVSQALSEGKEIAYLWDQDMVCVSAITKHVRGTKNSGSSFMERTDRATPWTCFCGTSRGKENMK